MSLAAALRAALAPAIARDRRRRVLTGWAAIAGGAAALALGLDALERHRGEGHPIAWGVLLATAAIAAIVRWRLVARAAPDHARIARLVERAHPGLEALLLTAVAQAPERADGALGFMQATLVAEATSRAAALPVRDAVPAWRLWLPGAATALATGALGWLAAGALMPDLPLPALFDDGFGAQITPGHGEVERGSGVLVLARFTKRVPGRATLVIRPQGRPALRLDMSKTLDDPVFGATTPEGTLDGDGAEYFVEYGGRRSPRYRLRTFAFPEVERLDARVDYPAQPRIAAREIREARHVSVTGGARVTVTVHLASEARSARLASGGDEAIALAPSGPRTFAGALTPTRPRSYEVLVVDAAGRTNKQPVRLTIDVSRNGPPRIAVLFPGRDVRVSPLEEVTLEARIEDDLALLGHGVSYRLGAGAAHELRLGGPAEGAQEQLARAVVALEALEARPDQVLAYHFWAEDADDEGKLRRTSSDLFFAEVRPFEERFREAPAQASNAAAGGAPPGDQLQRQKEIINATWRLVRDTDAAPESLRKDAAVVARAQELVREATGALRAEAREPRARAALDEAARAMGEAHTELGRGTREALGAALGPEQAAYAALLRLRERERGVGRGAGGGEGRPSGPQQDLAGLELKQRADRYETRTEAASASEASGGADRELLARLQELARRQEALTKRTKELEEARRAPGRGRAEGTPQDRLKRLRDDQQQLLGDLDRLLERTSTPDNRERMSEARAELERTRAEAQAAAEALGRGEPGRAVGASARAERGLEAVRGALHKRVASRYAAELQELRTQAHRLDDEQGPIGEALGRLAGDGPGPATPTEPRRLAAALARQRKDAADLLTRMQRLSEAAEAGEPLLARKLEDGLRRARTEALEEALGGASERLAHNLGKDALPLEARGRRGLAELRRSVDEAARAAIGDDAEALRLAKGTLDGLLDEARQSKGGGALGGPWIERLRDVEDLLGDPGQRTQAAQLRDRARALRAEEKRQGASPAWSLWEAQVLAPLGELRDQVGAELRRVSGTGELAPVDRDPVPGRYSELVRRYYKRLSEGQ